VRGISARGCSTRAGSTRGVSIVRGSTGSTGAIVSGVGGVSGRAFFEPPRPSHEAKSSQPRFFGAAGAAGVGAGGICVIGAGFGGSGRDGRTGGEVTSAPNSWANVSQLGFFD
jgi:hypothetical protein